MRILVVFGLFALLAMSTAWAGPPSSQPASRPARALEDVKSLRVTKAVLRLPPGGRGSGAVYLVVENLSEQPERLLGAHTPISGHVMLHETVVEGDVAKMVHAKGFVIPGKGRLELAPGGRHIMVMGLGPKIKPKARVSLTLELERAGEVRIEVPVEAFGE